LFIGGQIVWDGIGINYYDALSSIEQISDRSKKVRCAQVELYLPRSYPSLLSHKQTKHHHKTCRSAYMQNLNRKTGSRIREPPSSLSSNHWIITSSFAPHFRRCASNAQCPNHMVPKAPNWLIQRVLRLLQQRGLAAIRRDLFQIQYMGTFNWGWVIDNSRAFRLKSNDWDPS
jgi:hypothetical protein